MIRVTWHESILFRLTFDTWKFRSPRLPCSSDGVYPKSPACARTFDPTRITGLGLTSEYQILRENVAEISAVLPRELSASSQLLFNSPDSARHFKEDRACT